MTDVSLIHCDDYAQKNLKDKIYQSLSNIGFDLKQFTNARVVVKPNLLMPAREEKAIITHPEFFRAVVRVVKENNGIPVLVESPAIHSLGRVLKKTPYGAVVDDEKIEVADPTDTRTLVFEAARKFKYIDISNAYFEADIILSLPKFKTPWDYLHHRCG